MLEKTGVSCKKKERAEGATNTASALTINADERGPRMAVKSQYNTFGVILNPERDVNARGNPA